MDKYDVAIVGAGPSGIYCARKLQAHGKKIAIFEKSKNIGGRLATRRMDGHTFNVGVNSFKSTVEELNEMVEAGIEDETLIRDGVEVKATESITRWTKLLAKDIPVFHQHFVEKIETRDNENILHFRDKEPVAAKDVIIAAPAPQAYKILNRSGVKFEQLQKARYSSAIYYMVALNRELEDSQDFEILQHVKKDKEFYLLSFKKPWTEKSKEQLRKEFDQAFKPLESHVHKWKFAQVTRPISSDCQLALKDRSIYLTGDYFFGDDVDSSALAAQSVLENVFHID